HHAIDELNQQLAPFKIFKGIESDILPNGDLDYSDEVLAEFDFTIVSVHMGLNMDQRKATDRLIKAISNPFTTILGHATGRLLLKREGYPIDHQAVIDACAAYDVVIEINANPWRLDLDWRWVPYAIQKGVKLSINPDAHHHADIANV
ncbi:DNA polymerase/3'-5' exonuclease PolX, partial [Rhizobium leguminosarum]|nr:DNA polymerase/3'-5' exonuclease PolX [Rhizobium leguminosarum]